MNELTLELVKELWKKAINELDIKRSKKKELIIAINNV